MGARIYWGLEDGDQRLGRAFVLSQTQEIPEAHFLARFRDLALWVQYPEKNVFEEAAKIKGSELSNLEKSVIEERLNYVELWLANYAPEEFQWRAKEKLPTRAKELTSEQRAFLQELNQLLDSRSDWQAQDLQQAIFELAKNSVGAKQGFSAIYLAFLGKNSGPRAAWFLLDLDPQLRLKRIKELSNE
jgi:lysyl-tRNA synthetase, class I